MSTGTPPEDDIGPIRESLPPGPPAPVIPILLQWVLLTFAGFTLRIPVAMEGIYEMARIGGVIAVVIAALISGYLMTTRPVISRFSGAAGLVMAAGFLVWTLSAKTP